MKNAEPTTKKQELETLIRTERNNAITNIAKCVGAPILTIAGIIGVSELFSYNLESHDLRILVGTGIAIAGGYFASSCGLLSYVVDKYEDFRHSLDSIHTYKNEIKLKQL